MNESIKFIQSIAAHTIPFQARCTDPFSAKVTLKCNITDFEMTYPLAFLYVQKMAYILMDFFWIFHFLPNSHFLEFGHKNEEYVISKSVMIN